MRVLATFLLLAAITTGGAEASSFVVLEPMTESVGPSMIVLGAPAPGATSILVTEAAVAVPAPSPTTLPGHVAPRSGQIVLSPSVIAMGEPAPAIEYENVAAIPPGAEKEKKPPQSVAMPMVIRGGLVGDAFEGPAAVVTPQATTQDSPAVDPSDAGTSAKRKALKKQQQPQAAVPEPEAEAPAQDPPVQVLE